MKYTFVIFTIFAIVCITTASHLKRKIRKRTDPVPEASAVPVDEIKGKYNIRVYLNGSTAPSCTGSLNVDLIKKPDTDELKASLPISCDNLTQDIFSAITIQGGTSSLRFLPYRLCSPFEKVVPAIELPYIQTTVHFSGNSNILKIVFINCIKDEHQNQLVGYLQNNVGKSKSEITSLKGEIYKTTTEFVGNRNSQKVAVGGKTQLEQESVKLDGEIKVLEEQIANTKNLIAAKETELSASENKKQELNLKIENLRNEFNALSSSKHDKENAVASLSSTSQDKSKAILNYNTIIQQSQNKFNSDIGTLKFEAPGDNSEALVNDAEKGFLAKNVQRVKSNLEKIIP